MKPSVHYLEFGDEATPSIDAFGLLWQLDVTKPPAGDNDKLWSGIVEGDLVVFPSLQTGAGEFEAVRVIGPQNGDRLLPVLPLGVEYPEFPTVIVQLAESNDISLRQLYEAPPAAA